LAVGGPAREGRRVDSPQGVSCAVCGLSDARALVKTELADGQRVVVCATHALVHQKLGFKARSVEELRTTSRERRRPSGRRESFPKDELGAMLTAGFAGERRNGTDRRG
jgi:hypothetical protein